MSRTFPGTNSNFLQAANADPIGISNFTPNGITVFYWCKVTTWTSDKLVWQYANNTSGDYKIAGQLWGTNQFSTFGDQTLANQRAVTTTSGSTGVWYPVLNEFDSDGTLRIQALGDTVNYNGSQTWQADSSPTFTLGNGYDNYTPASVELAHFTVWDTILSGANITSLQGGAVPSTIGSPVRYWALDGSGNETDSIASEVLTMTGTVGTSPDPLGGSIVPVLMNHYMDMK